MESLVTFLIFLGLVGVVAVPYWLKNARQRREAAKIYEKNAKAGMLHPATLHPKIDLLACIGCAACVRVCPEGVMGIIDGRAAVVSGMRCIGHGLCEAACPVGGITLGFGKPRAGQEIPYYDEYYQSNVEGLYIIGELGGVGLVRNAVSQALKAMDHLVTTHPQGPPDGFDVIIVGAGPAGLTAALACKEKGLRYLVLEQDEIGGTILHYPKQKLVLTQPVELPLYGRLKFTEITKEELLGIWQDIVARFKLNIKTHHKVDAIDQLSDHFSVNAGGNTYTSKKVLLAIGRRGSPRKLGVTGENLSKVMYRLMDAESYIGKHALVVGGGDSAVEAAVGLASQKGNHVTISYRREDFVRLKEKNEARIKNMIASKKVTVLFNSQVTEIKPEAVTILEGENVFHNLQNDFVFVFAGGELPAELLKRIGIKLRTSDVDVKAA
jgi:putative YpdA family bacillithiol system oxidoreductase